MRFGKINKEAIWQIATAITILFLLIFAVGCANCRSDNGRQPESSEDYALPTLMVDGKLYCCNLDKIVDAPDESEIAGRITNYIQPSRVPETNDTSNTICCVNQPYAFVDGDLIVYAVNVHLSGALPEHTVDAWFYCEPYKW